jgi:TfuA protein
MRDLDVFIFAGPSLFGTEIDTNSGNGISWLPPARRGGIEELVANVSTPGAIGLADGTFHSYPSVSHVELREAMEAGWTVFGLCSMGAIRVCEMRHMGMKPWGKVAHMFCDDANLADDEVALVHDSESPYAPLSEPLVHIREFLAKACQREWLMADQADRVVESLRQRWYGERTLANLRQTLREVLDLDELPTPIAGAIDSFEVYRLKQSDLLSFVNSKPWLCEVTA